MIDITLILLNIVVFLGYFIKGITGFGGAVITVSIGTLLVGPYDAIILSAVYETIAGGILMTRIPLGKGRLFWFPLAIAMIGGTIAGGVLLKLFPAHIFSPLLDLVFFVFGVWLLMERTDMNESKLVTEFPDRCHSLDYIVGVAAGLLAGLFGTGGPPLAYWLGRRCGKHVFRGTLIPVFLLSSVVRVITYGCIGFFHSRIGALTLFTLPGLILGTLLGNRIFFALPERIYGRIIGVVLILVVIKLIVK